MLVILQEIYAFIASHPLFVGIYVCVQLVGVLFAFIAIYTARTSQGAIAWIGALLTFPMLSVPLFVLFGQRRFQKYVRIRARHDAQSTFQKDLRELIGKYIVQPQDEFGRGRVLRKLSDLPFTNHNNAQLLIDGEKTFDAILHSISQATDYILFQFYIIRDDELGCRVRDALIERAKADVRVFLLYDSIGSYGTKSQYFQQLIDAGVEVNGFKTTKGFVNRFQLNFRNHRKIVIVDGHTAFVGGHNVGNEYLGEDEVLTPWRDTHMRIEGPAVQKIQLTFMEDWRWATHAVPDLKWEPLPANDASRTMFVLPSSPADDFETCGLFFHHAINSATRRIWIASPYFVPDEATSSALQLADRRAHV